MSYINEGNPDVKAGLFVLCTTENGLAMTYGVC